MTPVALILADESKKSGPIGLVVILVLCIACYFLFKSMSGHMRKVREEFPAGSAAPSGSDAASEPSVPPSADGDVPPAQAATAPDAAAPPVATQPAQPSQDDG